MTKIKSFIGCPYKPLTRDQAEFFVELSLAESSSNVFGKETAEEIGALGCIMLGRLNLVPGLAVTDSLAFWVLVLAEGNPGNAVLWAYTLKCLFQQKGKPILALVDWVEVFPNGIPTKEAYEELWSSQKDERGRNRLDTKEAWFLD